MITLQKINVTETSIGKGVHIDAHRPDNKQINIARFFKPYYEKGLKIKTIHYSTITGKLNANLVPQN